MVVRARGVFVKTSEMLFKASGVFVKASGVFVKASGVEPTQRKNASDFSTQGVCNVL